MELLLKVEQNFICMNLAGSNRFQSEVIYSVNAEYMFMYSALTWILWINRLYKYLIVFNPKAKKKKISHRNSKQGPEDSIEMYIFFHFYCQKGNFRPLNELKLLCD